MQSPTAVTTARLQFGHACLRVETRTGDDEHDDYTRFNSATPACAWRLTFSMGYLW